MYGFGLIEEPDRPLDRSGTEVHVSLCRGEIHVAGELLNRSCRRPAHREVRTERVPQPMNAALRELRTPGCSSDVDLDDLLRER